MIRAGMWARRVALAVGFAVGLWGLGAVVATIVLLGHGDAMLTLLLLLLAALGALPVVVPIVAVAKPRVRAWRLARRDLRRRRRDGERYRARAAEREAREVAEARAAGPLRVEAHRVRELGR